MLKKYKIRINQIINVAKPGDTASKVFDIFIMTLIALNVIAVILETVESLAQQFTSFFWTFEVVSVIIFTVEYILRLWVCTENKKYKHSIIGRIRFAFTVLPMIDLLAILPFYIPMIIPVDLRFLRAIRLIRLFRLFKVGRYSRSVKLLGSVLRSKKEELVVTVFAVFILLICASSVMYLVEKQAQPDNFSSIPAAMWWGVATLTTVGYGDVYPITTIGKIAGAVIALLGIGLFALPTGILASGLIVAIQKKDKDKKRCPHCGKVID